MKDAIERAKQHSKRIIEDIFSFLEKLREEELEYLLVFSVLPATFVSVDRICDLLGIHPANVRPAVYANLEKGIQELHLKGWLERREYEQIVQYRLYPMIGKKVRSLYEPLYKEGYQEKYWDLGVNLLLKLDFSKSNFEIIQYFPFVEAYLFALEVKDMGAIEGELCLAYLFVLMELEEFECAFDIAEKGLEILQHLEDDRVVVVLEDLIVCCEVLGRLEDLGRYESMLEEECKD